MDVLAIDHQQQQLHQLTLRGQKKAAYFVKFDVAIKMPQITHQQRRMKTSNMRYLAKSSKEQGQMIWWSNKLYTLVIVQLYI